MINKGLFSKGKPPAVILKCQLLSLCKAKKVSGASGKVQALGDSNPETLYFFVVRGGFIRKKNERCFIAEEIKKDQ